MNKNLILLLLTLIFAFNAHAIDRKKYNFNSRWQLKQTDEASAKSEDCDDKEWKMVTLPYAWNQEEAFSRSCDSLSTGVVWYRKHFNLSAEQVSNTKLILEFEGARMLAEVYVNGKYAGRSENGVMAFGIDITEKVKAGENVIAVKTDNDWQYRERAKGSDGQERNAKFQWHDHNFYANYGGLPKGVTLHVMNKVYQTLPLFRNLQTTGVYVYGKNYDIKKRCAIVHAESEIKNETAENKTFTYEVTVKEVDGKVLKTFSGGKFTVKAGETAMAKAESKLTGLHFWAPGYGYLYNVETVLVDENGTIFDKVVTRTGFRKTKFAEGKIWLNDRLIQMKGYAPRSTNEWPSLGQSAPAWMSDFSNKLCVEGNGNFYRWMHVTPAKKDIESCDRMGVIQVMPFGDSEKDREGKQWEQRCELARDAIIYNRNNPSILFYEGGNFKISPEHQMDLNRIRDQYDPMGGRASGCREQLDVKEAEWGGEMLYINKSAGKPMFQTEYCRDEGLRVNWDNWSWPYHKNGEGLLYKNAPSADWNHNMDDLAVEWVRRWYEYWLERPGQGTRVNSGGAKIIFAESNTHARGAESYRTSGAVDAMRIPKDGYFAHKVMWDGWVDNEKPQTYIIGHWNYEEDEPTAMLGNKSNEKVVKPVYVVSSDENVELYVNGKKQAKPERKYNFLYIFNNVTFEPGTLEAKASKSSYKIETAGRPAAIRLTKIENPSGFVADGHDVAILQYEVVDAQGRRCPVDHRFFTFSVNGEGQYIGGLAAGGRNGFTRGIKDDHSETDDYHSSDPAYHNWIGEHTLPIECGIGRIMVRSTTTAGDITVTAKADGLPEATTTFTTKAINDFGGLSDYFQSDLLPLNLSKGETPATPSCREVYRGVKIVEVMAGTNQSDAKNTIDDNEKTEWSNDGNLETAWITYKLAKKAVVDNISLKMLGWKSRSYPLEIYVGEELVWSGNTEQTLGYIRLHMQKKVLGNQVTIKLKGSASTKDIFAMKELAGGNANEMDAAANKKGKNSIGIVEAEILEKADGKR